MSAYSDECAKRCVWCAEKLDLASGAGWHYFIDGNAVTARKCTGPTLEQFAEEQAAKIRELEACLALLESRT